MSAKRILIINGPNLNLLGKRNPDVYGNKSFEDFFVELKTQFLSLELDYYQSNIEGEIITKIQESDHDGIVLNAGGYTHTSVAIRDAVEASSVDVVEVHISNISSRESFRHESLITPVSVGCVFGFGMKGYAVAIQSFL
jgi:3-dehydroquinate dehydratase-2